MKEIRRRLRHALASRLFALSLAAFSGIITSCDSGPGKGEQLGTAGQAVEEGHFVCEEGVGGVPSVVWLNTFQGIQTLSRLDLRITNPYAFPITVTLTLTSLGLDQRLVKRAQGSTQVAGGGSSVRNIDLTQLPIQGVSYSSMGIVELAVDRGSDTIHMASAPFHYHFNAAYSAISVYSLDTMNSQLGGGQLTSDAFDLRGRVWNGASYVDITTMRQEEGLPLPWAGPQRHTEPPGPQPEPDPWPTVSDLEVCFQWQAKYIDSGNYGQDYGNNGQYNYWHQAIAAYAWVNITRVISYPCDAGSPGDPCLTSVWKGYLDSHGCVPLGDVPTGTYFAWPISYFEVERPGAAPCPTDPTGPPCPYRATVVYYDANDVEKGAMGLRVPFSVNVSDIIVLIPGALEMTNPGAALSQLLANTDVAVSTTNGPIQPPQVNVMSTRRCLTAGCALPADDARTNGRHVYTGPWVRLDNGKPGGLQWKNVLAHEYGHVQNHYGSGAFAIAYGDDTPSQPLCKCDHVVSTGKSHCLQSREEIGSAQLEGLAQFFAAKTWNDPTQPNCSLAYYKEFCVAEPCTNQSNIQKPPFAADCYATPKWRNTHCFNATRGTERDWMTFYWRINNNAPFTTQLNDLWQIYKQACGGSCDDDPGVAWPTLRNAAQTYFANQPNHFQHFNTWGGLAGVNESP